MNLNPCQSPIQNQTGEKSSHKSTALLGNKANASPDVKEIPAPITNNTGISSSSFGTLYRINCRSSYKNKKLNLLKT